MKKSILILGPLGSGKTTKLKEILKEMVEAGHDCVEISFSEFIRTFPKEKFKGKVLFIDEITHYYFEMLLGAEILYSIRFVAASNYVRLPEYFDNFDNDSFEIINIPDKSIKAKH